MSLDPNHKIALVFGNEHDGISIEVIKNVERLSTYPNDGLLREFQHFCIRLLSFCMIFESELLQAEIPNFFLSWGRKARNFESMVYRDV